MLFVNLLLKYIGYRKRKRNYSKKVIAEEVQARLCALFYNATVQ